MEVGAEVGCGRWDGVDEGGAGVRFGGIVLERCPVVVGWM